MSGKHDPPNKASLLAEDPRIESVCQLMVAAAAAQFPEKPQAMGDASRASQAETTQALAHTQARAVDHPNLKRGRKRVVTPERVTLICGMLAKGETETAGCLRAGIGLTAWNLAKSSNHELRERVAAARGIWASLRHQQYAAARYESQSARSAGLKALKPQPTRQAKWVTHYLTTQVPLHFAAIPEQQIAAACERCRLTIETWRRQERAFNLMRKVYANRAKIRGQQQPAILLPAAWIATGLHRFR